MSPSLLRLGAILDTCAKLAVDEMPTRVVEVKGDRSLVTNVDRLVETQLREVLPKEWEGTTVWGEEFGYEEPGPNGIWLVDPIDGTSNFAYGNPLWGISIALQDSTGLLLGGIAMPQLGYTLLAERGGGAFWNGEPMLPIPAGPIKVTELLSVNDGAYRRMGSDVPGKPRLSGAFVVDGAFTAKQWFRGLVGMNERLYDVATCVLAGRELGAEVRYLDGTAWSELDLLGDMKISKPWGILPVGSGL